MNQIVLKDDGAETNTFAVLAAIDCSKHIERKGRFSYLSWPWAVDTLRRVKPDATWEIKRFDGLPYLKSDCGYFVEVAVTVDGVALSQIHPVLDSRNAPIKQPNAFDINTSLMRCLVKAIALHGLGLYIYAGEDLPPDGKAKDDTGDGGENVVTDDAPKHEPITDDPVDLVKVEFAKVQAVKLVDEHDAVGPSEESRKLARGIMHPLNSNERVEFKTRMEAVKGSAKGSVYGIFKKYYYWEAVTPGEEMHDGL